MSIFKAGDIIRDRRVGSFYVIESYNLISTTIKRWNMLTDSEYEGPCIGSVEVTANAFEMWRPAASIAVSPEPVSVNLVEVSGLMLGDKIRHHGGVSTISALKSNGNGKWFTIEVVEHTGEYLYSILDRVELVQR